ncbi:MAG TPA: FxLYD domain-containing protein [Actinomycetota bacterium]|nr:FxLYD domain-containing protein [Actinomycetota bacterium]
MSVVGLVIGGLLVVGVVNSAMSGDNQPQATGSQTSTEAPAKAKKDSGVSSGLGTKDATADVKVVGISGNEFLREVELLITNHSSGRSDYYVELSLLDASGTNVGWTNALVQALEPGQKARAKAPITDDSAVKVKVHEVQRTASS